MKWALLTIASGYYPEFQSLQQSWNSASARLVEVSLSPYQPTLTRTLTATVDQPLSPGLIEQFLGEALPAARAAQCEFVLCYYIGHLLVNAGGQLALLQGPANEKLVASSVASKDWPESAAFLRVEHLHRLLTRGGTPSLFLVDGCMESGTVAQLLAEHGFRFDPMHPGVMLYTGPNEFVTSREAAAVSAALSDFGKSAAYLRGSDPIAFAAKPGTYAMGQPNPAYEGGPPIAPLAAGLHRWVGLFEMRETTLPDLKTLLDRVVGWRGVGEVNMSGGISWSDFERLDRITRRIRPDGYRSTRDARLAIVRTIAVPAGTIEDFVRDTVAGDFVAQVHHLDPSGANRWTLWRLPVIGSAGPTLLLPDILFPKITFGDGALYFERDDHELLRWPAGARKPAKIQAEAGFRELAQSYDGRSILALDADSVYEKGGDRLLRFQGSKSEVVATAELTQAKRVVEYAPGQFAWLAEGRQGVVQFLTSTGKLPRDLAVAEEDLDALCWNGSHFFSLNTKRERLYRFSLDGQVEGAWLQDEADNPLVSSPRGSGVLHAYRDELWVATENQLLQLDAKKLDWNRTDDK